MSTRLPDYFASPESEEAAVLRSVKGNLRKKMILAHLEEEPISLVPEHWKQHDLPEQLKAALQAQHPRARGGEDLPNLLPDEVEVARLSLIDSVHGEVTSLRAKPGAKANQIELRMVDEYGTEFALKEHLVTRSQTAEEVLAIFWSAVPSPVETTCKFELSSHFYPDLNDLAMSFER